MQGKIIKQIEPNNIYNMDCLEGLKLLADNSIDSIVTDPPYELGFMNKKWDNTGIAYNVNLWKECLRVLKPGGHMLAFGGTRTYHRMACAIEDAGFEIRDQIQWLYGCLDEATEVLTSSGWKKYFELSSEDEVLQWDSKTSELSWTKPSKIHTYLYEGKMYHFANRHTDQLLTPNHRLYGKFRRHSRNPKPDMFEVVEAQHIKQHWQKNLPVAGLYRGGKHVDESYAYLVGWWLTDAWAHQDGKACMFSQSKPDTLLKLREALRLKLREALSRFDCSFSEYTKAPRKDTHNAEHTFYVTGGLANKLLNEFPTRELNISMLEWNIDSRKALLKGLLDGDGTYRDGQHCVVFWSKKKERLDLVQLLAMSLNYRTLIDYKKGCVHINPKTNTTQLQHRHTHDVVDYKGDVWCVTVPKGAFVVRRNGKVFITGNSGFPKSHNISKAIDKKLGVKREVIAKKQHSKNFKNAMENKTGYLQDNANKNNSKCFGYGIEEITKPFSSEAQQWDGWGTALKPANEPICLARKPLSEKTIADNVLKWGTGGINIDRCRIPADGLKPQMRGTGVHKTGNDRITGWNKDDYDGQYIPNKQGRFPANIILDEIAGEMLDEQSGILKSGALKPYQEKHKNVTSYQMNRYKTFTQSANQGGASRFFYCAKASKKERNIGLEDTVEIIRNDGRNEGLDSGNVPHNRGNIPKKNHHPTVKPLKLISYLITLITPPNGISLDIFLGSGTHALACIDKGFNYIGFELEKEYFEIAQKRIEGYIR